MWPEPVHSILHQRHAPGWGGDKGLRSQTPAHREGHGFSCCHRASFSRWAQDGVHSRGGQRPGPSAGSPLLLDLSSDTAHHPRLSRTPPLNTLWGQVDAGRPARGTWDGPQSVGEASQWGGQGPVGCPGGWKVDRLKEDSGMGPESWSGTEPPVLELGSEWGSGTRRDPVRFRPPGQDAHWLHPSTDTHSYVHGRSLRVCTSPGWVGVRGGC